MKEYSKIFSVINQCFPYSMLVGKADDLCWEKHFSQEYREIIRQNFGNPYYLQIDHHRNYASCACSEELSLLRADSNRFHALNMEQIQQHISKMFRPTFGIFKKKFPQNWLFLYISKYDDTVHDYEWVFFKTEEDLMKARLLE